MDTGQGRKSFTTLVTFLVRVMLQVTCFLHVWKFNLREINPEPSVTDWWLQLMLLVQVSPTWDFNKTHSINTFPSNSDSKNKTQDEDLLHLFLCFILLPCPFLFVQQHDHENTVHERWWCYLLWRKEIRFWILQPGDFKPQVRWDLVCSSLWADCCMGC